MSSLQKIKIDGSIVDDLLERIRDSEYLEDQDKKRKLIAQFPSQMGKAFNLEIDLNEPDGNRSAGKATVRQAMYMWVEDRVDAIPDWIPYETDKDERALLRKQLKAYKNLLSKLGQNPDKGKIPILPY